ncbi:MAG: CAP domain-containing protein [Acidiferrobacterales bacterium]|nr:CAP domain-containing protein [Acidiferrobacterales bacterium]
MSGCKLLVCLFVGFILSGCGGGSSDTDPPSGGVSATPSPTPVSEATPTPTPTPTVEATPTPGASPAPTPSPVVSPEPMAVLDCGEISGGIINNNLNDEAKAYFLCKHNQSRSEVALGAFSGSNGNLPAATNMKRLQWSDKLAQVSQNWADQCVWQHNGNRQTEYNALSPTNIDGDPIAGNESVGENLAFFASSALTSATIGFAVDGYDAWIDEGHAYSFGELNVNDFCSDPTCGHFTQAIWADTYKVGCAVNFCQAGSVSSLPATYLVCNYASAGNYIGREPYESSDSINDVCSTADTGQTVCANGLTESASYQSGL